MDKIEKELKEYKERLMSMSRKELINEAIINKASATFLQLVIESMNSNLETLHKQVKLNTENTKDNTKQLKKVANRIKTVVKKEVK